MLLSETAPSKGRLFFQDFLFKESESDARIPADTSLGVVLLLFRGSAVNGPSVKSVGLKARGPALLGPDAQWSTVNYFTLIVPSCNFSCFLMQAEMKRVACYQIRNFLFEHPQNYYLIPHEQRGLDAAGVKTEL